VLSPPRGGLIAAGVHPGALAPAGPARGVGGLCRGSTTRKGVYIHFGLTNLHIYAEYVCNKRLTNSLTRERSFASPP